MTAGRCARGSMRRAIASWPSAASSTRNPASLEVDAEQPSDGLGVVTDQDERCLALGAPAGLHTAHSRLVTSPGAGLAHPKHSAGHIGPRSSGDRAPPSGGGSVGSNPTGARTKHPLTCTNRSEGVLRATYVRLRFRPLRGMAHPPGARSAPPRTPHAERPVSWCLRSVADRGRPSRPGWRAARPVGRQAKRLVRDEHLEVTAGGRSGLDIL